MANVEIKFIDNYENESYINVNVIDWNDKNPINDEIIIRLFDVNNNNGSESIIILDKSTAIKFAKTLRTEINKIKEVENGNR